MRGNLEGLSGRRPYTVRWVEGTGRWRGLGEWCIEMPGVPPILFPAAQEDNETKVRAMAERILARVLPED